jgi:hypothetical protein
MSNSTLKKKEQKIATLVAALADLGPMRPGTLSLQYRNPRERKTPFHQISYTRKGRGRSEYVRPESLSAIKKELETHKKFRRIMELIVDLSLEASQLRHQRV